MGKQLFAGFYRLFKSPAAHGHDQVLLFQQRNELCRRDGRALVVPPQEHFTHGDLLGVLLHNGLDDDVKILKSIFYAARQRQHQFRFSLLVRQHIL